MDYPDGQLLGCGVAQEVLDPVERLHRGRGVVDRRGERLDRDVHHHADREGRIIVERPLVPEHQPAAQSLFR